MDDVSTKDVRLIIAHVTIVTCATRTAGDLRSKQPEYVYCWPFPAKVAGGPVEADTKALVHIRAHRVRGIINGTQNEYTYCALRWTEGRATPITQIDALTAPPNQIH